MQFAGGAAEALATPVSAHESDAPGAANGGCDALVKSRTLMPSPASGLKFALVPRK